MNLYEAIFTRKSVRKYKMESLDEEFHSHLRFFIKHLQAINYEIGVDIQMVDNTEDEIRFKRMFQVKAPYYLIISSELIEGYLENAGYLMQQIILYLTAQNIGCCYQGKVKLDFALKSKLKYDYVLAVAFGRGKTEIYREPKRAKRLSEREIVVYKEEVNETIKKIVKAGRWAPSAFNSQPWRFVVYSNRIHIFCKKGIFQKNVLSNYKLLDIGVMLANLTQAAEELWFGVTLIKIENISEKSYKNNEYMISALLKENSF